MNPLFQVCFAWQSNLSIPLDLKDLHGERITVGEGISAFDLTFYMWENGDCIEGEIEYNAEIIKQDTAIKIKDNYLALICNLIDNPDRSIDSVLMITEEDKKKILSFNDTATLYPKDKTIAQLFEEQVCLYPDKIAVAFKEEYYTYKQLNEKANQLAKTLRKLGVKDNSPVGLMVERSSDMIVGILGILKAGGGYVPIDPEYPEQRINFMIKDSGCKVLLMQDKCIKFPVSGVTKLNLNSPSTYHIERSNINLINSSSDLAYIMYTSGTTGTPKGSLILHKSVVRLVRNINYMELTPEDRILLTGAVVFDATTFEIWGALLNGGTLYLVDKETIISPKVLGEEIKKNEITVMWLTSPLLTQIAETHTEIFGELKWLLSGGDVLSANHINKVRKANPHLKVLNCYGPTENTTFSTTYLIEKDFEHNIPIGKPISNSTTYIFDKNLNYQPIGVIGELFVGGDGLSKGYLNRDDLNKKSFIDHPDIPGERLYRTGDYARWLPDGNIEFHGRMDNQLKIRGFRVEVGEVESVMSEIDGVIEAVVKPLKINEGDIRLAAFLNVSDTFNIDAKELDRQIKGKLPPYMIPSAFKFMHGFPKTINGKINKDALILDVNDIVGRENQDPDTLTDSERKILEIWSDVLKTKDILTTDNFFEIGGNSLLAISVMAKIESALNIELGLRVFFDSPRIKDIAEAIDIILQRRLKGDQTKKTGEKELKIIEGEI
jgi:amino acid adenylation domain-containing protein